jgi:hypothetical protein
MRSAKALAVPGTLLMAASMSRASFSITTRSGPMTLTPSGVRMPVASMSMRALMGMVQVPMIGGMVSSTLLTLMVIPAIFGLLKGWNLPAEAVTQRQLTEATEGNDHARHDDGHDVGNGSRPPAGVCSSDPRRRRVDQIPIRPMTSAALCCW